MLTSLISVGGNVLDIPLMYETIRNHHLIQKYFGEQTRETNFGNLDVDKDVSDILSDMLTESQIHKESDDVIHENNLMSDDDHVNEDVEADSVVSYGCVVNDFEMTSHEDEDFNLIGINVKQVVADKIRNIMLSAEEDGNFYDAENFTPISHLGAIRLIQILSCILKFKLYHMDVKSAFLNRYLNMEVNQDFSNYATNKDCVLNKDDYVEVDDDIRFVNIMKIIIKNITKSQDMAT